MGRIKSFYKKMVCTDGIEAVPAATECDSSEIDDTDSISTTSSSSIRFKRMIQRKSTGILSKAVKKSKDRSRRASFRDEQMIKVLRSFDEDFVALEKALEQELKSCNEAMGRTTAAAVSSARQLEVFLACVCSLYAGASVYPTEYQALVKWSLFMLYLCAVALKARGFFQHAEVLEQDFCRSHGSLSQSFHDCLDQIRVATQNATQQYYSQRVPAAGEAQQAKRDPELVLDLQAPSGKGDGDGDGDGDEAEFVRNEDIPLAISASPSLNVPDAALVTPRVSDHGTRRMSATHIDVALNGDGQGNPISPQQQRDILTVHMNVQQAVQADPEYLTRFTDLETCRRFLVGRSWDVPTATQLLLQSLKYRLKHKQVLTTPFQESAICDGDPWAMSFRCIGLDSVGRPVMYSALSQASKRGNVDGCISHLSALLESCLALLEKRRQAQRNTSAHQQQWVWIIDFHGFGLRDQRPSMVIKAAELLGHYPALMYRVVLLDAPVIFSATWSLIKKVYDKAHEVLFIKPKQVRVVLGALLGHEVAAWVDEETAKIRRHALTRAAPLGYWQRRDGEAHDSHGLASYVASDDFIPTPGTRYLALSAQ